jgi:hypothetical protein
MLESSRRASIIGESLKAASPLDDEVFLQNPELRDFLSRILDKDQTMRLGAVGGFEEIKAHPWFHGINWQDVFKKKLEMPWKPSKPQPHQTTRPVSPCDGQSFGDFTGFTMAAAPTMS